MPTTTTFQITQDGNPVPGLAFTDGATVAAFVKASPTGQYRIVKQVEIDLAAEYAKFNDGTYTPVPWAENYTYTTDFDRIHLCRISATDRTRIDFYHPETRALTTIRPGRWLTQYMSNLLSADEIENFAKLVGLPPATLLYATTADAIEDVYLRGPSSCMSHPVGDYNSPFHPVRVYAGPDLQLGYIEDDGQVVGRALIWPEKKTYGRIFSGRGSSGDYSYNRTHEVRMIEALKDAGYSKTPGLAGARIARHPYDGGFVCPYIDDHLAVSDDGTWLRIGGNISADRTNGITEEPEDEPETFYCEHCGEHYDVDIYASYEVQIDTAGRTQSWCSNCLDTHGFICSGTDEAYSDVVPHVTVEPYGELYSPTYIDENSDVFVQCPETELWYIIGSDAHKAWIAA